MIVFKLLTSVHENNNWRSGYELYIACEGVVYPLIMVDYCGKTNVITVAAWLVMRGGGFSFLLMRDGNSLFPLSERSRASPSSPPRWNSQAVWDSWHTSWPMEGSRLRSAATQLSSGRLWVVGWGPWILGQRERERGSIRVRPIITWGKYRIWPIGGWIKPFSN